MKNKIIVIICIFMLMGTITGEMRISASESDKKFVAGKMYLNGLEFSEETVMFSSEGEVYFSLDKFFEGIGGELTHNETTKETRIDYLNDTLLWMKGCMRREKNNANIKTVFANDWFPLGQMIEAGTTTIYEGRTYLSSDTFSKMKTYLGFEESEVGFDLKNKTVKIYSRTYNNDFEGGGGQSVYINDKHHPIRSLADGTYEVIDWFTYEEPQKLMLIDEEGRIYKKNRLCDESTDTKCILKQINSYNAQCG